MTPARTRKATKAVVSASIEGEVIESEDTVVDEADLISVGSLQFRMTRPTDDQLAVLAKVARAAERDPSSSLRAIEVFFKIIEKCLINQADGERLEDALIDGTISIRQITESISTKGDDASSAQTTARRTRRGR